jgi:hypothetical protein
MALQLKADSYGHSPQPEVIITRSPLMDETGLRRIGTNHQWQIRGTMGGTSTADLKAKLAALEAAYAAPAVLQLVEVGTGTVREQILGTDGRSGLVVEGGVSYPEGNAAEYATKRRYDITVKCEIWTGGEKGDPQILWLDEKTTYAVDQHGKTTRTVAGTLRTKYGVSAYGKLAAVTPVLLAGYNRMSARADVNDDDDEMSYSFDDVQYWQAWPAAVTGGQATIRTSKGDNGLVRVTVSGTFTGTGAAAAAAKLPAPQYRCVSEESTTNAYDGSVTFTYEYIDIVTSSTDLIAYEESSEVEYSQQAFVVMTALDGAIPIRQDTVITPARANQNGQAVGASAWPAFPGPLWAGTSIVSNRRTKSGPTRGPNGAYHDYKISWSYEYAFITNPIFHDPNKA